MMMRTLCLIICAVFVSSVCLADTRPNVLLVMADDLGYADLGCYGGEIETPRINSLAGEGLQFSHFRATTMCVTSRIALMSGMPMHRAGSHDYSQSIPLAQLLKASGYRTMMTGKWHGGSPDPRSRDLFDRSFGFLGGATDSFAGGGDWFLDANKFDEFGGDFYSTRAFTDRSIEFMKEAVALQRPFFMYVAFNAPHHPCQAPQQTVLKYSKSYQDGYEALRRKRRQRQVELGLVDPDWTAAPVGNEVRRWDELTDHRQRVEADRMAAYAAAVDEVDQGVGRLLDYLHDAGLEQNTLMIFLSDNGGDYSNGSITTDENQIPWQPRTNPSSSNGWASVKCSPFRHYKHSCHEGGIATPLVIRWPTGVTRPAGEIVDTPASITDIYPTVIELAGIEYPAEFEERQRRRPTGRSLLPLFEPDGTREASANFQWYSFSRAWIEDEWKAVSLYGGPWQLFDLGSDRCESTDVAESQPDRLVDFVNKWEEFATESDVPEASRRASEVQHGWGWHRLSRACPALVSLTPDNGATVQSTTIQLSLSFDRPIDFQGTAGKGISLYEVSDERNPVWHCDPDETHQSQGKRTIRFENIPTLKTDTHYAIRADAGWIKVGGRPAGVINDGAYWWRFRTSMVPQKPSGPRKP